MATTVADIGRLVGCSSATVSRAINNSGSVRPEIREAIFKVLRETKYPTQRTGRRGRPSGHQTRSETGLVEILYFRDTPIERLAVEQGQIAVGPFGHWSGKELLIESHEISGSFYRRIVDGAVAELKEWGYRAVLQTSNNLASDESLSEVNKPDRAGILLMGEYTESLEKFIDRCIHPLVLVDIIHETRLDVVTTDNQSGISQSFDHLYELGHRRIGFVGKLDSTKGFMERFVTFKWKCAETGVLVKPEWIHEGPNRIDETEAGVVKILRLEHRPTAFVCGNDCFALGVYRAANAVGVRIPDDLSVVGFDDDESASLVTPSLTTVRAPVMNIGSQSVRQLMLQIRHPQPDRTRGAILRLFPELIIRRSTAALR